MQTKPVPAPKPVVRRTYAPPRLFVHGTVATVTGFVKSGGDDGKAGSNIVP